MWAETEKIKATLDRFSTVIVTGGSSGIGRSFIKAIYSNVGQKILFCNLSRSKPERFSEGIRLEHFPCDLSDREDLTRTVDAIAEVIENEGETGSILLINNSGFGSYGPFPEPGLGHQLGILDVNIRACVHLAGLFLPLLKERGGVIMNIASTAAFQPTPYLSTYGASKAFLLHWSLALNEDLKGTGVSTLAVCPGPTATNFFRRAGFDEAPAGAALGQTSEQVVRASLKALAKGKSMVVSGWTNWLIALLGSKTPKAWSAPLAARVLKAARLEKHQSGKP